MANLISLLTSEASDAKSFEAVYQALRRVDGLVRCSTWRRTCAC